PGPPEHVTNNATTNARNREICIAGRVYFQRRRGESWAGSGRRHMGELTRMIQQRLDDAYASLRSAHADGDTYLADIRQEEINELRRIAANNDIGVEPPRCD